MEILCHFQQVAFEAVDFGLRGVSLWLLFFLLVSGGFAISMKKPCQAGLLEEVERQESTSMVRNTALLQQTEIWGVCYATINSYILSLAQGITWVPEAG